MRAVSFQFSQSDYADEEVDDAENGNTSSANFNIKQEKLDQADLLDLDAHFDQEINENVNDIWCKGETFNTLSSVLRERRKRRKAMFPTQLDRAKIYLFLFLLYLITFQIK